MAKFDVASAYWNVAIHPDDRPLLGMQWCGKYFVDMVLLLGVAFGVVYFQPRPQGAFPRRWGGKRPWHRPVT